MDDIGKKIKEARISLKLSVKDLSEKTKIRVFVIESIEKGDYSVMPEVYIKSFIKTLTQFLKINYTQPIEEKKSEKPSKKKFDDEAVINIIPNVTKPLKSKTESKPTNIISEIKFEDNFNNFKELFKQSKIDKDKRYLYLNRSIYIVLLLAVILALYFGITSINNSTSKLEDDELKNTIDTISLEEKTNNLFSYFEKPDSLRLYAKSHDTVWMRVLMDGKTITEALLKPGMEETWTAKEFFIVDLGNVGGADIFRNEEKLPLFGKRGSVVKNVKITATEVLNIYASKPDSTRAYKKKTEKDAPQKQPRMIEQSIIYTNPQLPVTKKDTTR